MRYECFAGISGGIESSTADWPCAVTNATNPYVPCCQSGDTCLSNGLCLDNQPFDITGTHPPSPYYIAGCTDPSLESELCPQHCRDQAAPIVAFDAKRQLWTCCSVDDDYNIDCDNPTSESWFAPNPTALIIIEEPAMSTQLWNQPWYSTVVASSPYSTPTTAMGTWPKGTLHTGSPMPNSNMPAPTPTDSPSAPTTGPSSSSSTPTPIPSQPASGLSAGAQVGIGVGTAAGILALFLLGLALLIRKKRKQQKFHELEASHSGSSGVVQVLQFPPPTANGMAKTRMLHPVEMDGHTTRAELPGAGGQGKSLRM